MMTDDATYSALKAIQAADPDGQEREPTEQDYRRHERWARETYGGYVWELYTDTSWGEAPESWM
jgi:hypothetical protein